MPSRVRQSILLSGKGEKSLQGSESGCYWAERKAALSWIDVKESVGKRWRYGNFSVKLLSNTMMKVHFRMSSVLVVLGLAMGVFVPLSRGWTAEGDKRWDPAKEVEIGKQASAEIEAEFPLVEDKETLDKLAATVDKIALLSERPEVKFTCKILKSDDVNAYSIPGGSILPDGSVQAGSTVYVTQGLLKFVHSDHELAGVLAHEIAHTAHYDALRQLDEYSRSSKDTLLAALAGMLISKGNANAAGLFYLAGQLVQTAKTHSYTITLEEEADLGALRYLSGTDYSPVGLLTFLERLDALGVTDPKEMGIFQDHPILVQRTIYISEYLIDKGIPINRREVAGGHWAILANVQEGDVTCHRVLIGDQVIFAPAPGEDCEQRSLDCLKSLNLLLEDNLESYEVQVVPNEKEGFDLVARGVVILSYLPSDGAHFGKSAEELAKESKQSLALALWKDSLPDTESPTEKATPQE